MTDISSLIAGGAVALVEVDPVDGAAIGDRIAAQAAASAAAGSATAAALDAVATAADRVATGQDRTATHTDRVAADADAVATAADRVATGVDRTATHADKLAADADAVATAADRVQTGLDRVATGADRTATHTDKVAADADAVATAADRVQTGLDRVQTGADRTATHTDKLAADADAAATAADRVQTGVGVVSANGSATTTLGYLNSVSALAITIASYALAAQLAAASASAVSQASLAGVTRATMLSATIGATFLYNARLDTDGGAWLRKVSKNSYARETLNTATRGSTALPPASSKWVGSTSLLSCYDFTNPASPVLWKSWDFTGRSISSISVLNGYVVIGTTGSGTIEFDLVLDKVFVRSSTGFFVADQNVATFVVSTAVYTNLGATASDGIVSGNGITAIAMSVQPLTPLNPNRYGLPNPTIVISSGSAINTIRSDNRAVSGTAGGNATSLGFIESGSERILVAAAANHLYVFDVGCVQSSFAPTHDYTQVQLPQLAGAAPTSMATGGKLVAMGTTIGASVLQRDRWTQANGVAAFISHRYNTGWVPLSAKFAFAESSADLSTLPATTNQAVNGDFGTGDLTGYTTHGVAGDAPVVSGGQCSLPASNYGSGNTFAEIAQVPSTVIGGIYRATFDVIGGAINCRVGNSFAVSDVLPVQFTAVGLARVVYFVATATTSYVSFYAGALQAGTTFIDNIKIERVIADRTSNGNSANIVGSITRAAVATGAELAAYGGFSASNYFEVPANAALEFANADMSAVLWVNRNVPSAFDALICYGTGSNDNTGGYFLFLTSTGVSLRVAGATYNATGAVPVGWNQIVCVIRGGFVEIYLNGKRILRTATAVSLSKVGSTLRFGNSDNSSVLTSTGVYLGGTMSIPRVSAGALTADQIAYMYDTERAMFQANAKCLLIGGASYTVCDVRQPAYDQTQDRFAYPVLGTGVSIFEGPLIRVGFFQASTASANKVKNSDFLNAAVGVWPSNLANPGTVQGITPSIVGAGPGYFDVRWQGTAVGAVNGSVGLNTLPIDTILQTAGQTWTFGIQHQLIAGALAGITFNNAPLFYNGGSFLASAAATFVPSATAQRTDVTATLPATTTRCRQDITMSCASGTVVDLTLRLSQFQVTQASSFTAYVPSLTGNDNVSRVSYSDGVLVMGDAVGVNTIFPSIALREKLTAQYPTPAYDPLHAIISMQTANATPTNMVLPLPILEGQSRIVYASVGAVQYGPTKTEKALYALMGRADRDVAANLAVNPSAQPAAATIYETTGTMDAQMAALTTGDIGALPVLSLTGKAATQIIWTAQIEIADNFQMAA
jgi:hypothetical protein